MKAANHLKTVGGCLKRLDQLTIKDSPPDKLDVSISNPRIR